LKELFFAYSGHIGLEGYSNAHWWVVKKIESLTQAYITSLEKHSDMVK